MGGPTSFCVGCLPRKKIQGLHWMLPPPPSPHRVWLGQVQGEQGLILHHAGQCGHQAPGGLSRSQRHPSSSDQWLLLAAMVLCWLQHQDPGAVIGEGGWWPPNTALTWASGGQPALPPALPHPTPNRSVKNGGH